MYKKIIGEHNVIHWDKLIWNRLSIPEHRVIGWLLMNQRLITSGILVQIGVMDSNQFMLCQSGLESHNHMFFQCSHSAQCL